jgi:hypothetical protein
MPASARKRRFAAAALKTSTPLAALAAIAALSLPGCGTSTQSNTTIKMGIYAHREIIIDTTGSGAGRRPTASVIAGAHRVFVYSEYHDNGEEGEGHNTCFTLPDSVDSAVYAPGKNPLLVIGFATGFLAGAADTVTSYNVEIVATADAAWPLRLKGRLGSRDISGEYRIE